MVDKVLRTFPIKYDSKLSTLEERDDLNIMKVDELQGIVTTYEMRIGQNEPSRKETSFKVSKETKKFQTPSKIHSESSDDEEALFTKKLERGTRK